MVAQLRGGEQTAAVRLANDWTLDPGITFLNHGSFGACPRVVQEAQSEWRARIERDPVRFFVDELEGELDAVRDELGAFLHADPADLVFVPNATTGVNTVLRSLRFEPGDELLTTDHEYNAVLNTLRDVAARSGARVVIAAVPLPVADPQAFTGAILEHVGPRTRLAVVSHVTSATATVFPIHAIVAGLRARGVDTLVDGAHAAGMVPLDLDALGAAYYTGNGHKWLCAPKGSGFLWVRRDRQASIRPLVTSHGANTPRRDRSRFRLEADWTGTGDPTPTLALPAALRFLAESCPGAWEGLRRRNRALCLAGRRTLLDALGGEPAVGDAMIGSMASVVVPEAMEPRGSLAAGEGSDPDDTLPDDPLHDALLRDDGIQVPVSIWPPVPRRARPPARLLRISAQLYNEPADFVRLADALRRRLPVRP
jgi:isopenicillin-N epimerase